jgi:hypothetical protein
MTQEITKSDLEERVLANEPAYETLEELRIGRMLDLYGIPFFYHEARMIYDQGRYHIERPGFTLPGYDGLVVDYANNLQTSNRQQLYQANGIPAIMVSQQELSQPDWPEKLYERIHQLYSNQASIYERFSKPYSSR